MASWASAHAAETTARWIELTLYAEVFGGLAAIVAAGFAGAAFVMSRRAAMASEKQANAAEIQLKLEKDRHAFDRDYRARELRGRLYFPKQPRAEIQIDNGHAAIRFTLGVGGHLGAEEVSPTLRLTFTIPNREFRFSCAPSTPKRATSLAPEEEIEFWFEPAFDSEVLREAGDTWFLLTAQIDFDWKDGQGYRIRESWNTQGSIHPKRTGALAQPRRMDYRVIPEDEIEA